MNDVMNHGSLPIFEASPRATDFIVTIYGDVVEPRGGILWMGTLIECCAQHGISESLVRTAVSRLVGLGRLQGERIGRKSYYRLSRAARDEFRDAARILFAPPPDPSGWLFALSGDGGDVNWPRGWARLAPGVGLGPDRPDLARPSGVLFCAHALEHPGLVEVAAQNWDLMNVAARYLAFTERFASFAGFDFGGLSDREALAIRLRLVDDFRHAALADPRLPPEALPTNWPATAARHLFGALYLALSPASDRYIGRHFANSEGLLDQGSVATLRRTETLKRSLPPALTSAFDAAPL